MPDTATYPGHRSADSGERHQHRGAPCAATPCPIVDRLNREIITALERPGVRDRLRDMGASPMPVWAQAFGEQFKREIDINAGLVKAVGLQTK